MSFFCRLSRKHYWCVPHRSSDNRLVQVCYECGAERPAHEFHNETSTRWYERSVASAKEELEKLSLEPVPEMSSSFIGSAQVIVNQGHTRKFALVK